MLDEYILFDWQLDDNRELVSMNMSEKELMVSGNNNDDDAGTPEKKPYVYKRQIVWFNALGFLVLHLGAVYGFYLYLTSSMILTMLWTTMLIVSSSLCVTMGAHRLYTHRSFKCSELVKAILVFGQTIAGQNCLYVWVRDHRQHHKYSDTNGDPHNASRGFFFSHIGWLMVRKHRDVIEKGKKIDMTDLEMDPYVMFQKNHYKVLFTALAMLMPMLVPYFLWGETLRNGFFVCFLFRLILVLNVTWLVNSAAHMYGTKPFTSDILPVECENLAFVLMGEGWHNYHHSFPWDYRAAEFGQYFNMTTELIDFLEEMGWVWDKKCATPAMVRSRATKRGDGSHHKYGRVKKERDEDELLQDETYDELFWLEDQGTKSMPREQLQKG